MMTKKEIAAQFKADRECQLARAGVVVLEQFPEPAPRRDVALLLKDVSSISVQVTPFNEDEKDRTKWTHWALVYFAGDKSAATEVYKTEAEARARFNRVLDFFLYAGR